MYLLTFFLLFYFIIYDSTIHYTISTTFFPSLLFYQLRIKTRVNSKRSISMDGGSIFMGYLKMKNIFILMKYSLRPIKDELLLYCFYFTHKIKLHKFSRCPGNRSSFLGRSEYFQSCGKGEKHFKDVS